MSCKRRKFYAFIRARIIDSARQLHQHYRWMGQLAPSVLQRSDQDSRWCLVSEHFEQGSNTN